MQKIPEVTKGIPIFGTIESMSGKPVVDSKDVRGGVHFVATEADVDKISDGVKEKGMLVVITTPQADGTFKIIQLADPVANTYNELGTANIPGIKSATGSIDFSKDAKLVGSSLIFTDGKGQSSTLDYAAINKILSAVTGGSLTPGGNSNIEFSVKNTMKHSIGKSTLVKLIPEADGYGLAKFMNYQGELIGYVLDPIQPGAVGKVMVMGNLEVGDTQAQAGDIAYIGRATTMDGTATITNDPSDLEENFGECGVYGTKSTVGNVEVDYVLFNAFQVQSNWFSVQSQVKNVAVINTSSPVNFPKDKFFVYANVNVKGNGETVSLDLEDVSEYRKGTTIVVTCKATDSNNKVEINTEAGQEIDGIGAFQIEPNESIEFIALGDHWLIMHRADRTSPKVITEAKEIYSYEGTLPVKLPTDAMQGYYLTIHGLTSIGNIELPGLSTVAPGTEFIIDNQDVTDAIRVAAPSGMTIGENSATAVNVPKGNIAVFIKKSDKSWAYAYSGYMPSSLQRVVQDVKQAINKGISLNVDTKSFKGISDITFEGATVTSPSVGKAVVTFTGGGTSSGSGSLIVDDGTTSKGGVSEIDFDGGLVITQVYDDSPKIKIRAATGWANMNGAGGGRTSQVKVMEPLQVYLDPNTKPWAEPRTILEVKHGYYALATPPSYLAYLTEPVKVLGASSNGKIDVKAGPVWFDEIIVPGNSELTTSKVDKSIVLQDYDPADDPNVSGGKPFLVSFLANLKGNAVDDGYVEIALKKKDKGTANQNGDYLLDANGNPIAARRDYKIGEKLDKLEITAIYIGKEYTEVQPIVEHTFVDDGVMLEDGVTGPSGIMIQGLADDYKTGPALVQYEQDTACDIKFGSRYFGEDYKSLKYSMGEREIPMKTGEVGQGMDTVDNIHFYNNTKLKLGVTSDHLVIQDDGTDLAYFSLGHVFTAEETAMLRGKELDVSAIITDKQNAFTVSLVKWVGGQNQYTRKIIDQYGNPDGKGERVVTEKKWELVDGQDMFISEDPVKGDHTATGTFTVPEDAVNFAIILYPRTGPINPLLLKVKDFKIDVKKPYTGWILRAPVPHKEKYLAFSNRHVVFKTICPQMYASYRYTITNNETKLPVGVKHSGYADVTNNHAWKDVGAADPYKVEGDLEFATQGTVRIFSKILVYPGEGIPKGKTAGLNINWKKKPNGDEGIFEDIPLSSVDKTLTSGQQPTTVISTFEIDVMPGDTLRMFGETDIPTGAYTYNTQGKELISVDIEYKEFSTKDPYEYLPGNSEPKVY